MSSEYLYKNQKPKILLINFEKAEEDVFKAKNYNVEIGWASDRAHFFPSPGYEYDIVVARFDKVGFESAKKTLIGQLAINTDDDYDGLNKKIYNAGFAIIFTPDDTIDLGSLKCCGIEELNLGDLDSRDTTYTILNIDGIDHPIPPSLSFTCSLLKRNAGDIFKPVPKEVCWNRGYNENIIPLATNDANKTISAIFYNKKTEFIKENNDWKNIWTPKFVVLPPFKKGHTKIALEFLSQLSNWCPDIFPSDLNYSWLDDRKYWSRNMIDTEGDIKIEKERTEKIIEELQEKHLYEVSVDQTFRQILIADDSGEFDDGNKLTVAIQEVLEYLGFDIENSDKENTSGKRRQDLVCRDSDDNFIALIECKGTVSQNPPETYVTQLLSHMIAGKVDRGILIINHDRKRDAFIRNLPYEDAPHILSDMENITIISTVELFKLLRKVQEDGLSKEEARRFIKTKGRMEIK